MTRPEACLGCGLCVDVCPVERAGGRAFVSSLAGDGSEAQTGGAWLCTSCWQCQEACPAGVEIHTLMMEQRRREPAPEGYQRAFESVLRCGYALTVGPEVNGIRAACGLEPFELVPPGRVRMLLGKGDSP